MNFFLDNNLLPNWSAVLSACSNDQFGPGVVGKVVHLRERFHASTPDTVWMGQLGNEKQWTILSGDAFRKANGAERKVLRAQKLSVFVLQPSWSSHTYWDKTAQLVHWWPRIVEQSAVVDGIAMEVPWLTRGKFKQL